MITTHVASDINATAAGSEVPCICEQRDIRLYTLTGDLCHTFLAPKGFDRNNGVSLYNDRSYPMFMVASCVHGTQRCILPPR